jgi:hypothetical protein
MHLILRRAEGPSRRMRKPRSIYLEAQDLHIFQFFAASFETLRSSG